MISRRRSFFSFTPEKNRKIFLSFFPIDGCLEPKILGVSGGIYFLPVTKLEKSNKSFFKTEGFLWAILVVISRRKRSSLIHSREKFKNIFLRRFPLPLKTLGLVEGGIFKNCLSQIFFRTSFPEPVFSCDRWEEENFRLKSLLIKSQGENEVNFRTDFEYNK